MSLPINLTNFLQSTRNSSGLVDYVVAAKVWRESVPISTRNQFNRFLILCMQKAHMGMPAKSTLKNLSKDLLPASEAQESKSPVQTALPVLKPIIWNRQELATIRITDEENRSYRNHYSKYHSRDACEDAAFVFYSPSCRELLGNLVFDLASELLTGYLRVTSEFLAMLSASKSTVDQNFEFRIDTPDALGKPFIAAIEDTAKDQCRFRTGVCTFYSYNQPLFDLMEVADTLCASHSLDAIKILLPERD